MCTEQSDLICEAKTKTIEGKNIQFNNNTLKLQINNLTFTLRYQKKKERIKSKGNRRKEITKNREK